MKKFFIKIKNWFKKIKPTKRKIVQLYVALLYNANLKGFIKGEIYTGKTKITCVPGLNCYSCPGAVGACPLGSLQNAIASANKSLPFYVLGIIMLYGLIFGRTICGWLCPVGLSQELLYKIKTPKLQKSRVTRILSYFKYVLLFLLVVVIPVIYINASAQIPAFCKYVCPAGVFEGGFFLIGHSNNSILYTLLGAIFTWKFFLFVIFVVASIFIFRFFCRFICPLGAIYGFFNKFSFLGVKVDKDKCNECGMCVDHCKMDVKKVGDHECIQCGECIEGCPSKAISYKLSKMSLSDIEKENETVEVETNKKSKRKTTRLVLQIIAVLVLVASLVYFNFFDTASKKSSPKANDFSDFSVQLYSGNEYILDNDDAKVTMLYFYEDKNDVDFALLETIKNEHSEKVEIITVHAYTNHEEMESYVDENVASKLMYAYDNQENSALKVIDENMSYPATVFLDSKHNFIYKKDFIFVSDNISYYINPFIEGKIMGAEVGNVVANYSVNTYLEKGVFNVEDYRGKFLVINFWSTTCEPCKHEMQYFEQFYDTYKDDVQVVAIHSKDITESVEDFIYDYVGNWFEYDLLFAQDNSKMAFKDFFTNSASLPFTVIVDKYGVIQVKTQASMTFDKLDSYYNQYK